MNIYLILPLNEKEEINPLLSEYISELEFQGDTVSYMEKVAEEGDENGYKTCQNALREMTKSDEVHIFWSEDSANMFFELGMAFALKKDIILINPEDIEPNDEVSFENMICYWSYWDEK